LFNGKYIQLEGESDSAMLKYAIEHRSSSLVPRIKRDGISTRFKASD